MSTNSFQLLTQPQQNDDGIKSTPSKRRNRKKSQSKSLNSPDSDGTFSAIASPSIAHDDSSFSISRSDTLGRSKSFDQLALETAATAPHTTALTDALDLPASPLEPLLNTPQAARSLTDIPHALTARALRSGKPDPFGTASQSFSPMHPRLSPGAFSIRDVRAISALEANAPDSPGLLALGRRDIGFIPAPSPPPRQRLKEYLSAELLPGPSYATTDAVWGQTERDRVYNSLIWVPFQLERLIVFGTALCLDSFLAMFTLLPIRVWLAVWSFFKTAPVVVNDNGNSSTPMTTPFSTDTQKPSASPKTQVEPHTTGGPTTAAKGASKRLLRGDQLFDILCASMFSVVVAFLWNLRAGSIYFWVKDLTQEFLKISVLHTALELADKICCSFGIDVLIALGASCTHAVGAGRGSWHAISNLLSDAFMATALVVAHGAALMSQSLVFSVAMNSRKNTLIALLIASNFTEIKGTVFKRFDPTRIFILACQDIVERFHLALVLLFVAVEEAAGAGRLTPSRQIMTQCGYVFMAEVVIDIVKHAVLVKFNEIRPGVYREFMRDLCDKVTGAQSHTVHRLVGFEPFAPCALFLRLAATFFVVLNENQDDESSEPSRKRTAMLVGGYVVIWLAIVVLKIVLGYVLKMMAVHYVGQYDAERASNRNRAAGGVGGGQHHKFSAVKKDE